MSGELGGYAGRVVRVDLTGEAISIEELDSDALKKYVGGTGLGAKYLYEEVPAGIAWCDPGNRLLWFAGPLGGTRVSGSGTFSVVTKGPMTNFAAATQANGFFGAYVRFSGFDGLIVQGTARRWVYLYIHDGTAELRDALHLLGKDTRETEDAIRRELGVFCSVFGIGPAGENLVRFAAIVGDHGHVAAHNGVGAVMGAKRLKAVVARRGEQRVPLKDPSRLAQIAPLLFENALSGSHGFGETLRKGGTAGFFSAVAVGGMLPVRNYTTSIFPEHARFDGKYLRTHFEIKPRPCWACRLGHCHVMKVTEGPYQGFVGDEPDYESVAAFSSLIGQLDPGATVMLANLADRLGMDVNESGWVTAWVMECYEEGLLTRGDLDGLEMHWGNVDSVRVLLEKIAHRQGIGKLLAEGVKRAAESVGGEAKDRAIYTYKGASPRSHDHRANWPELLDTCLSNTGTIESTGGYAQPEQLGLAPLGNGFDPQEVSTMNAKLNGRRQFEDCLGVCRFCAYDLRLTLDALNAITGWGLSIAEAMDTGLRVVNLLRMFNLRHGLTKEMEAPSRRYSSAPVDGPAQGKTVAPHWDSMRRCYYQFMGWDPETGKPLPETLRRLGLGYLVDDLRSGGE